MLRVADDDDDNDEVQFDDVLGAMADSLLEVVAQPTIVNVPDQPPILPPRVKKPPKEVFYKESIRFAPKAPMPVMRQRCTCRYLCHGAKAEIKCLSCALYEPSGVSYYCRKCFEVRHPWHRVTHIFTTIYQDELIGITMKIQREKIETDRYLEEGSILKEKIMHNLDRVEKVADDAAAEDNMRLIGRKLHGIEDRLRNMRSGFRHTLLADGVKLQFTDEDGIAVIQRVFRGFRIRRVMSLLYAERIVRVWDPDAGRDFFYDREGQKSSWTPPMLLMRMDYHRLVVMELDEHGNTQPRHRWPCKKLRKRKPNNRIGQSSEAARIITGFFQCIRARNRIIVVAKQLYARVWDPDYEQHYYSNLRTGDSSWAKPAVLLSHEAPLLLLEGQNKRSPRVNREQLLIGTEVSVDELSIVSR